MEEYFFGVAIVVEAKVAHIVVADKEVAHIVVASEEVAHIVVADEEVVQPFDVVEEAVQELIDSAEDSSVVLYLFLHVHDHMTNVVSWK